MHVKLRYTYELRLTNVSRVAPLAPLFLIAEESIDCLFLYVLCLVND